MARRSQSENASAWPVLLEDEATGYKRALVPVRYLWEHRSDYNPRKPIEKGGKFYGDLSDSLDQYGLVEDPVFNLRTDTLVGGEQRVHVIYDQDPDAQIPAVLIDCDPEQEVHLCVLLNRLHNEFDDAKLADVFKMLRANENFHQLKVTGFDREDVSAIMQRFLENAPTPEPPPRDIICPHCGHTGPAKEFETDETEPCPGKEAEG